MNVCLTFYFLWYQKLSLISNVLLLDRKRKMKLGQYDILCSYQREGGESMSMYTGITKLLVFMLLWRIIFTFSFIFAPRVQAWYLFWLWKFFRWNFSTYPALISLEIYFLVEVLVFFCLFSVGCFNLVGTSTFFNT